MRNSNLAFLFCMVTCFCSGSSAAQDVKRAQRKKAFTVEDFGYKELAAWDAYGMGAIEANHGQTVMYETRGSLGYMLVSPRSYGESTIVSFDVMPLNAATVLVVEMAAHNSKEYELILDPGYNGNVKYLFENVQMYMFAFHNAAHNKTGPFVRKYPDPGADPLVAASKNVIKTGIYQHVEVGIDEGNLWFKSDGKKIWKVDDPDFYRGGKVIIRLRGTAHETASCIIKNLKIYSKNSSLGQSKGNL